MQPGTWELRRLYMVASPSDEAKADETDDDLMRKLGTLQPMFPIRLRPRLLDLDEVVLEVPTWARFLVSQYRGFDKTTRTGTGFSEYAMDGRVIVVIAGSRRTVKEGMKEVIRRIEGHAQYKEGDICLRRIRGQPVDTAGFRTTGDAKPLDFSSCKEPFDWKRYHFSQEQGRNRWSYP